MISIDNRLIIKTRRLQILHLVLMFRDSFQPYEQLNEPPFLRGFFF